MCSCADVQQINKHLHSPEQLFHPRLTMSTPRSAYNGKSPKNSIQLLHTRTEECMRVVVYGCCATKLFSCRFASRCNNMWATTIGTIHETKKKERNGEKEINAEKT